MAKIDTSGWKPFVVGELFPSMVKPPVLHARQVVETDEGITLKMLTYHSDKKEIIIMDHPTECGFIVFEK